MENLFFKEEIPTVCFESRNSQNFKWSFSFKFDLFSTKFSKFSHLKVNIKVPEMLVLEGRIMIL